MSVEDEGGLLSDPSLGLFDWLLPAIDTSKPKGPIWSTAPLLTGQTRFDPRPDVKNIMITGGAGFIASWVARHLTITYKGHYNIISFDKLDYCATLHNTAQLDRESNFTFFKGDITNSNDILTCLKTHSIDTVMHFAAQSHVDLSFGNSYDFTLTNVYGTHVLLECCRSSPSIKKFIHVSTDEVYGGVAPSATAVLESSLLAPTNPYAASKAAAEMLVHAYMKAFKLPVIVVRSNNVYGPHQYPEKIVPKFILLLARGEKLPLHGSGQHTRRYLYAGDAADAFDTVLHKGEDGHVYNIGSEDEVSNVQLAGLLMEQFGLDGGMVEGRVVRGQDRPFNDTRYAIDGSRLRKLGWEQRTSLQEGLRRTVEWYTEEGRGERWWGDIGDRLLPFPEMPAVEQVGVMNGHQE